MSRRTVLIELSDQGITKAPQLVEHRALEVTAGGIEECRNLVWTQSEANQFRPIGLLDLFLGRV